MTEAVTTTPNNMAALYAALAAAQGEFLPIEKNREVEITMKTGGRYKFRYADLQEVLAKTRPALAKNGLALVQLVQPGVLVCQLMHANGGLLVSEVPLASARDLGDPKAFGAAITYLRRYMVTAMLGVAADDDLDEDGQEAGSYSQPEKQAVQMPQRRQQEQRSAPEQAQARAQHQQQAEQTGDPASKLQVTAGEFKWLEGKINSLGIAWEEAYKRAGIPFDPVEPQPITKAHFTLLKAVL